MSDPMPKWIPPMLAKLSGSLPEDDQRWAYEMKWDGIRGLAFIQSGALRLLTRNQIEVTRRYPELRQLGSALGGRYAILDGEIVGFDDLGRPRFEALQQRMGVDGNHRTPARPDVAVAYMIFDVLYLDDVSLLQLPYEERRGHLESLQLESDHWQTPYYSVGSGQAMLEAGREQGMEGVVAKRLGSKYEPGKRTGAWTKVKNVHRQEFVIGGWIPGQGRRGGRLGSVLVGYYQDGKLISAGGVGTGFTNQMLAELAKLLEPLERPDSPFAGGRVPREAVFVEPRLVCEVEFAEWTTRSGELRHPSFKGLRWDKSAEEVVRED
jgi:bifunctional non-homologous end joining protein LigD